MNKIKRITAAAVSAAIAFSSAAAFAVDTETKRDIKLSSDYKNYERIAGYVAESYIDENLTVDEIMLQGLSKYLEDNDDALVGMLKSMLSSLDEYSEFMTAEEFQKFNAAINQTFYGIGISMKQADGYVEIGGFVEENSLAEQSGFMVGDKIVKINGTDVVGWSVTDIRGKIIGEVNTTVNITVLRDGEYIDLVGIRTEVRQNTVISDIFEKNIGYIKISSFGDNTAKEFAEVLDDFSNKEVTNIILDLRNNTGGRLDAAVKISEMLVPKGRIVEIRHRQPENNVIYESKLMNTTKKLIVLVNEHTASSSEILASAVQDSGAGRLLGTQTYGKGVVQQTYTLTNGSVFKLTVAQYITRNGREIHNVGLTPDIFVINTKNQIDSTQYTNFDFRTKWAVGSTGSGVKAAKERLYMLGYYTGATDSDAFYTDLRSAVKAFQLDEGLAPYGVIDIPTQVKMQRRFEAIDMYTDNQLEEAYKIFGGSVNDLYKN